MAGFLDKSEIEIPCGGCKRKLKKSIGWIKTHSELACGCGAKTKIDASQFKREIAKAEKSFAKFQQALKNFGK